MNSEFRLLSAIDIGSHELRMKIVQVNKDGSFETLDEVNNIIPLGRDTFTMNKLSFESVNTLCEMLEGYKQLMNDYGVKTCKVVATSALRESENKDYIIDQIKLRTGFNVNVINNFQEKYYSFKMLKNVIESNDKNLANKNALILDIGAGTIQVSIYKDSLIKTSRSMKLGSLRISEILSSLQNRTLNYTKVLEEYIDAHIENNGFIDIENKKLNFFVIGGVSDIIASLLNAKSSDTQLKNINKDDFDGLYEKLINNSTNLISKELEIDYEKADILVPTLIVIKRFFDKSKSDTMVVPNISLVDGIIYYNAYIKRRNSLRKYTDDDIISYTKKLAKQFNYNKDHSDYVENAALHIFDNLKNIHGLKKERCFLQLAAILHDIGKFLSSEPHYEHTFSLIKSCGILGMSDSELDIIANVAKYHSSQLPSTEHVSFSRLKSKNKVMVAKLISIIRLADSLDTSHKQKIRIKKINIVKNNLIIEGESDEEVLLEQWTFDSKSEFFIEVFGITPVLKVKVINF